MVAEICHHSNERCDQVKSLTEQSNANLIVFMTKNCQWKKNGACNWLRGSMVYHYRSTSTYNLCVSFSFNFLVVEDRWADKVRWVEIWADKIKWAEIWEEWVTKEWWEVSCCCSFKICCKSRKHISIYKRFLFRIADWKKVVLEWNSKSSVLN